MQIGSMNEEDVLQALFLCGGIANGLKQDFMVPLLLFLWIGPGSLDFHSSRGGCAIASARGSNEKVGPLGRVRKAAQAMTYFSSSAHP